MKRRLPLTVIFLLCLAASGVAVLRMAWAVLMAPDRAWQLSVAFDQLANASANGDADETISSRAGKARLRGKKWGCVLCKLLDALDPDHCNRFMERDRGDLLDKVT